MYVILITKAVYLRLPETLDQETDKKGEQEEAHQELIHEKPAPRRLAPRLERDHIDGPHPITEHGQLEGGEESVGDVHKVDFVAYGPPGGGGEGEIVGAEGGGVEVDGDDREHVPGGG